MSKKQNKLIKHKAEVALVIRDQLLARNASLSGIHTGFVAAAEHLWMVGAHTFAVWHICTIWAPCLPGRARQWTMYHRDKPFRRQHLRGESERGQPALAGRSFIEELRSLVLSRKIIQDPLVESSMRARTTTLRVGLAEPSLCSRTVIMLVRQQGGEIDFGIEN